MQDYVVIPPKGSIHRRFCCHCEERSDEAISTLIALWPSRLLRFARNDGTVSPMGSGIRHGTKSVG
jgi:hypothetical protein